MATASFICNVEDSEESLKTAVSSHQLRHRVCSHRLLQVLVGLLAVFVVALTGGVIWMKLGQENKVIPVWNNRDWPERLWTVSITGTKTNFTSPRTQKYAIFGEIFTKTNPTQYNVDLMEGEALSIQLNCEVETDEEKSKLFVYQQNP